MDLSILTFSTVLPYGDRQAKPVQTLQNKALKIMTNTRWHHSASPLY